MKNIVKIIFACIAILGGITAIIKILGNPELIVGILSLTFGITALIWTILAHTSLSPGSSLRNYTTYFIACLFFILLFSVWKSITSLMPEKETYMVVEYLFLTLAYIVFAVAANKIYHIGIEFGFQPQARRIRGVITSFDKKRKK